MPGHVRTVRWIAFGVIAAGELVLVLGPWLLAALRWLTSKDADWWGAAGQWAGALGSVAAVVVALWIARKGARDASQIAGLAAREAAARDLRRQRASAMLVHGQFPDLEGREVVSIVNDSEFPVVDVRIVGIRGTAVPLAPPSDGWPVHAVVRPGKPVGTPPMFRRPTHGKHYGAQNMPLYTIVIEFTDVEGYRWRRKGEGLPELMA